MHPHDERTWTRQRLEERDVGNLPQNQANRAAITYPNSPLFTIALKKASDFRMHAIGVDACSCTGTPTILLFWTCI